MNDTALLKIYYDTNTVRENEADTMEKMPRNYE